MISDEPDFCCGIQAFSKQSHLLIWTGRLEPPPGRARRHRRSSSGPVVAQPPSDAWGVADATVKVPNDSGAGVIGSGSTFTDPNNNAANWVMFRPEGIPVSFTPGCALGGIGSGVGGAYVTNGKRDYAMVLSPLGGIRVHGWNGAGDGWTN